VIVGIPLRVLFVTASQGDTVRLVRELWRAGYDVRFERVADPAALVAALQRSWDVVIGDRASTLTLVQEHDRDVPFVLVVSPLDEEAAVEAMRRGARDYLFKAGLGRLGPLVARELRDAALRRDQRRLPAAPGGP
jgi:two-component system sensor histidine kinase UhpB